MEYGSTLGSVHQQRQGTGKATILGPNRGVDTLERAGNLERQIKARDKRAEKVQKQRDDAQRRREDRKWLRDMYTTQFDAGINQQEQVNKYGRDTFLKTLSEMFSEDQKIDIGDPRFGTAMMGFGETAKMAKRSKNYEAAGKANMDLIATDPSKFSKDYKDSVAKAINNKGKVNDLDVEDFGIPEYASPTVMKQINGIFKDVQWGSENPGDVLQTVLHSERGPDFTGELETKLGQLLELTTKERQAEIKADAEEHGYSDVVEFGTQLGMNPKKDVSAIAFDKEAWYDGMSGKSTKVEKTSIEGKDGVTITNEGSKFDSEHFRAMLQNDIVQKNWHLVEEAEDKGNIDVSPDASPYEKLMATVDFHEEQAKLYRGKKDTVYKEATDRLTAKDYKDERETQIWQEGVMGNDVGEVNSKLGDLLGGSIFGMEVVSAKFEPQRLGPADRKNIVVITLDDISERFKSMGVPALPPGASGQDFLDAMAKLTTDKSEKMFLDQAKNVVLEDGQAKLFLDRSDPQFLSAVTAYWERGGAKQEFSEGSYYNPLNK